MATAVLFQKKVDKHPIHVVTPSEFVDFILPEILKSLEKEEEIKPRNR